MNKQELSRLIREEILRRDEYSFEYSDTEVKLDQNESPYDLPAQIKGEILEAAGSQKWNRYPSLDGSRLRQALSDQLQLPHAMISVGVGSDELLNAIGNMTLSPGKRMLIVEPTFRIYSQIQEVNDAMVISLSLDSDMAYPVEKIINVLSTVTVDLTVIASPNNPTGSSITIDDIERIAGTANGLVVIDEAYFEFSCITALPLLKKFNNLVISRTFSKAFGLAGLRAGYIIAEPDIIKCIHKVKMPFSLNVFSETAAVMLLNNMEIIENKLELIRVEKRFLYEQLQEMDEVRIFRSDANFFLIDTGMTGKKIVRELTGLGIAVRDVSNYPGLDNCIRVTVGKPKENRMFLAALKSLIDKGKTIKDKEGGECVIQQ